MKGALLAGIITFVVILSVGLPLDLEILDPLTLLLIALFLGVVVFLILAIKKQMREDALDREIDEDDGEEESHL